jgi:glycosyltransferase involved in cell wall biosynthesis
MTNCTDSEGIFGSSYRLACNFERDGWDNLVLTIQIRKPLSELGDDLPRTIHTPTALSVLRELSKFKPDILIIHRYFGLPLGLFFALASKTLGIKSIILPDIAEYNLPRFKRRSMIRLIKDTAKYALIRSQSILIDKIVFRTDYEKEIIEPIVPHSDKFHVIPIGCDFEIGTSKKEDYILTVSKWWRDRKNLHTILKVFSEVIKDEKCRLLIVGKFFEGRDDEVESYDGRCETGEEYEQKILKLIEDLNLEEDVEFISIKKGKELEELFRSALIYYMPSKNETFGMVFTEAMASGTPIVAMKNSAVKYVVKDGITGFLRDAEEGQREAILRLLKDRALYEEMRQNCLKEAKGYRWESIVQRWESFITTL